MAFLGAEILLKCKLSGGTSVSNRSVIPRSTGCAAEPLQVTLIKLTHNCYIVVLAFATLSGASSASRRGLNSLGTCNARVHTVAVREDGESFQRNISFTGMLQRINVSINKLLNRAHRRTAINHVNDQNS